LFAIQPHENFTFLIVLLAQVMLCVCVYVCIIECVILYCWLLNWPLCLHKQSLAVGHFNILHLTDSMIEGIPCRVNRNSVGQEISCNMEPKVFHCVHAVGPHCKPLQSSLPLPTIF
jgi:hypothetical protein